MDQEKVKLICEKLHETLDETVAKPGSAIIIFNPGDGEEGSLQYSLIDLPVDFLVFLINQILEAEHIDKRVSVIVGSTPNININFVE